MPFKVVKSSPLDLVITDLSMPRMDGFELVAYLEQKLSSKSQSIVMTCFGTPKIEEILRDMGDFHYIEKPIDHSLARLIPGRHYRPEAYSSLF